MEGGVKSKSTFPVGVRGAVMLVEGLAAGELSRSGRESGRQGRCFVALAQHMGKVRYCICFALP